MPDGTVGLLAVKTPSRTPGYWKNPRLTSSFELNGYWLTGDVARRDGEGNFYHLDRTVDVIDTAAGPVYSLPIEEVLLADCADMVQDCAVVGVPGPTGQGAGARSPWSGCRPTPADGPPRRSWRRPTRSWPTPAWRRWPRCASPARRRTTRSGPTGKVLKRELRTRFATLLAG